MDLIDMAKNLGIIFNNVDIQYKNYHFLILVKNIEKEVDIKIPKTFIVPREALEIDDKSHYFLKEYISNQKIYEFLNEFLLVALNKEKIEKFNKIIEEINEMPEKIKDNLKKLNINFSGYSVMNIKNLILTPFFYKDEFKEYFIPFIESFDYNKYNGEIIIYEKYQKRQVYPKVNNKLDVFHFFSEFLEYIPSTYSYSIKNLIDLENDFLRIRRNLKKTALWNMKDVDIEYANNKIICDFLLIGSQYTPRKPYWIFEENFKKFDLSTKKHLVTFYSKIKSKNLYYFTELMENLVNIKTDTSLLLQKMILQQLKNISESYEEIKS